MSFGQDLLVSVQDLCFTKETIYVTFSRPRDQERIDDAVNLIDEGYLSPKAFPSMNVVEIEDRLWSLDNRRLWVFKKAKVPSITVRLIRDEDDRFRKLLSFSESSYRTLLSPSFSPKVLGDCTGKFVDDLNQSDGPACFSSLPVALRAAGGGHSQPSTRVCKQSILSAAPHVRKPDRPRKRPECAPPKVAELSSTTSRHLRYDERSDHYIPSHSRNHHNDNRLSQFWNRELDESSRSRTLGSVVSTPSIRSGGDEPVLQNTKKLYHETEHRRPSSRTAREACSPRPSEKLRGAPAQTRVVEGFGPAPSPALSGRNEERRPSVRVKETKAFASMQKPPGECFPHPGKEPRPSSPARTTRSPETNAGRPENLPSRNTTRSRRFSTYHELPIVQKFQEKQHSLSPLSKDKYFQQGREVQGSADKPPLPPAPALKRSKTSRGTSKPKNFSYDFHNSSRRRRKTSKGYKNIALAQARTTTYLLTELPDYGRLDVSVPSPVSPKTQRVVPEKPPERVLSSSTNTKPGKFSTTVRQTTDDNFSFDLVHAEKHQDEHPLSETLPTVAKTREEDEARKLVDFAPEAQFLSDTENNFFKLDKQAAPPRLPSFSSQFEMNATEQQLMKEIMEKLLNNKEDALRKEPVDAERANDLPSRRPMDVVPEKQAPQDEEVQHASVQVKVRKSTIECPVKHRIEGQLLEFQDVDGRRVAPSTPYYGGGDVHGVATNGTLNVLPGSDPHKVQEPQSLWRRGGFAEMARTAKSGVILNLTASTEAKPTLGNELQQDSKRITRGDLQRQKAIERRIAKQKRRELRETEKCRSERDVKSPVVNEQSKDVTTAIVPYVPEERPSSNCKGKSSGPKTVVLGGDQAYIRVSGELTQSVAEGGSTRLHPYLRLLGPFGVIKRCNAYSALLDLPYEWGLKPVLELAVLTTSRNPLNNGLSQKRLSIALSPEKVLNKRVARRLRKQKVIHYLVKWKDLPATEATWESKTIFEEYPHLLDDVDLSQWFANPFLLRNWKA